MATKDLSRTVIEGGRRFSNHFERDHSHRRERAALRRYQAHLDGDAADHTAPEPRPRVGKQFRDKLGPVGRWLRSQVGRSWDKVRAEVVRRFDARTVAGQHILHDHLLPPRRWVSDGLAAEDDFGPHRDGFFVDAQGRLQLHTTRTRARIGRTGPRVMDTDELRRWVGDRRVGRRGGTLFWFHPVGRVRERWVSCAAPYRCPLPIAHRWNGRDGRWGRPVLHRIVWGTYVQGRPLVDEERRYFAAVMKEVAAYLTV